MTLRQAIGFVRDLAIGTAVLWLVIAGCIKFAELMT